MAQYVQGTNPGHAGNTTSGHIGNTHGNHVVGNHSGHAVVTHSDNGHSANGQARQPAVGHNPFASTSLAGPSTAPAQLLGQHEHRPQLHSPVRAGYDQIRGSPLAGSPAPGNYSNRVQRGMPNLNSDSRSGRNPSANHHGTRDFSRRPPEGWVRHCAQSWTITVLINHMSELK